MLRTGEGEVLKGTVSGMIVALLLTSLFTLSYEISQVKASGTIYIRADGSIDPLTAPIQRNGDTYTLTGNITSSFDGIVIERSNMTLDGAGYTVVGSRDPQYRGVRVFSQRNVTVGNVIVTNFTYGIQLWHSNNSNVVGNNLLHNDYDDILIDGIGNNASCNNITTDSFSAVDLSRSGNYVAKNNMSGAGIAIWGAESTISENSILNGGISMADSTGSYNSIFKNDLSGVCGMWVGGSHNSIDSNSIEKNDTGYCIYLASSQADSSIISNNSLTGGSVGVEIHSSNNGISGNNITSDNGNGIYIQSIFQGPPSSNNSISMNNITNNRFGIWLNGVSNNTILENSFTYNERAVYLLDSSNNSLLENNITDNNYGTVGIHLYGSSNNSVSRNVLSSNLQRFKGIELDESPNNSLCENIIAKNTYGIYLYISSNNSFYHNDFKNNTNQVYDDSWQNPSVPQSINAWDDEYPSGGNYWSDHTDVDSYSGPNQDIPGNDGIWDHPYIIDANNRDHYPLVQQWVSDITPPETCILSPQNTTYTTSSVPLTFTVNEATSWIGYSLDSQANMTTTGNSTLTGLALGPHNVIVYANDTYGNMGSSDIVYFSVDTTIHDIAVSNVTSSKTVVGEGYTLNVTVTVENHGGNTETFNVTLYANSTIIGSQENLILTSDNSTMLTFTWDTTGFTKGNYTINATATQVPGETNTEDNTLVDGIVYVGIRGDVNVDGVVELMDFYAACTAYLSTPGKPNWNPNADINDDGVVELMDFFIMSQHYLEHT
jgi:parallel beta-helix repeat protein